MELNRELLRISVLVSWVAVSSAFALWPFASFFQPQTTPAYHFQPQTTPAYYHFQPQTTPAYHHFQPQTSPAYHHFQPQTTPAYHFQATTAPTVVQQQQPVYTPPASGKQADTGNQRSSTDAVADTFHTYSNNINNIKQPLFKMPADGVLKLTSFSPRDKRCFYEGHYYDPLTEISNGRSGDWCYGSYCNHEGKVTHWDDFNCPLVIDPTPAPTTPPAPSNAGCVYYGVWYPAGADIENYEVYGQCYGTYCDWTSNVVHWEDNCYATVPSIPMAPTPRPDIFKKK